MKQSGEENIVIDCSYEILEEVLKQSQQVGILSDQHRVIVSNLVSAEAGKIFKNRTSMDSCEFHSGSEDM